MSELTDFLLARIAEVEAENADSHSRGALHTNSCAIHPQGVEDTWCDCDTPARVLAECEAKRRIVEAYLPGASPAMDSVDGEFVILPLLALPYADHTDYRGAWVLELD